MWPWRQPERREQARTAPPEADQVAIARWVQEGRELLDLWQEKVERLGELQSRLAGMAEEIGRLQTQLRRMDDLQAENLRLNQEAEALVLEREQLRTALARIGELIERVGESRPGRAGEAGA
jgi:chromosome segregation ATPase